MARGHRLTQSAALELPDGFDPCGVPCVDAGRHPRRGTAAHRRPHRSLPGLAPTSVIASVEAVAAQGEREWLVWGSVAERPVLVAIEAGTAAEMLHAVAAGETATAIVEPWQVMLERLD
jgi:hypothetical protein